MSRWRSAAARNLSGLNVPVTLMISVGLIVLLGSLFGDGPTRLTMTEMLIRMIVVVGIYVFVGNSGEFRSDISGSWRWELTLPYGQNATPVGRI